MLKKVRLEKFRNHKKAEFDLQKTNIIIGDNGIGKSNILEAIALLSCCRSFREEDKRNLVNFDEDFARVTSDELEVFIQKSPRLLLKTKHKSIFVKRSEFIGLFPSVIFSPETLNIVTGNPKERRRFLDMLISQMNRPYLDSLIGYEKTRIQRNNLLQLIAKGSAKRDELLFWNGELIRQGQSIIEERKKVVDELNIILVSIYQSIAGSKDHLKIEYLDTSEGNFELKLRQLEQREIMSGHTIIGPHRDDLKIKLNNWEVSKFASRGEIRSAVLSLKIAETKLLEQILIDKKPILLLDDIFSEFDAKRRGHLFNLIKDYQTVITTTDRNFLSEESLSAANIIELGRKEKPARNNY